MRKVPKQEARRRIEETARIIGLLDHLDRKPKQLSGGQRQRVAMGRAIVREPQVFLMDEPLSNLDAKLRVQMRAEIFRIQRQLRVTTVYVTHDQVEAMTMGDRVCVLKDGVLQQVDTPLGLYDHPANLFVAGFIGSPAMNLLQAKLSDNGASVNGHEVPLAITPADRQGHSGDITIGIRPEDCRVSETDEGVPVRVTIVEELGADAFVYGEAEDNQTSAIGEGTPVVVRVEARRRFDKGSTIYVTADPKEVHVFDTDSGERIGTRA